MSLVMDKYDAMDEDSTLKHFSLIFGFSQCLGALSVILVAVWMGNYDGGFGWTSEPEQEFHYHPLFMVVGLIFLYGESILVYRVFRHERKRFTKTLHVLLHSMIFIFFVLALKAVFDSHNLAKKPTPNMYSLHSWVGLSTVLLFCFQYVAAFVTFLAPGLSFPLRTWYLPIHQTFGMAIFILSVLASLMGISERAAWHIKCWSDLCSEGMLANFLGITIVLYATCVLYLVANPRYRRRALPEEESMQQLTSD